MNKHLRFHLLFIAFLTIALPFSALADDPPDFGGDPGTPIDGGASLLVGAAVVYGAKKLKDKKTKSNTEA